MKNELRLRNTNLTYNKDELNLKKRHISTFLRPHVGVKRGLYLTSVSTGGRTGWQVQPPVEQKMTIDRLERGVNFEPPLSCSTGGSTCLSLRSQN